MLSSELISEVSESQDTQREHFSNHILKFLFAENPRNVIIRSIYKKQEIPGSVSNRNGDLLRQRKGADGYDKQISDPKYGKCSFL